MRYKLDLGVQSWCFRHFPENAVVAKKIRELGLSRVELCAVHADFGNPDAFSRVVQCYRDEGVSIVSLGVQTFLGQESEKAWFECAAKAGAGHISCHFTVDTFMRAIPLVRRWSREYGVRVGIHCHGGHIFGGQPEVIAYLLALGGPEIGLCMDTAWAMQLGPKQGNPIEWVKRFGRQLCGIHFKDFIFERDGQWKDVVVGSGNLKLPEFTQALGEAGFAGMAVLEYEADVENPTPALKRCLESMRTVIDT